MINEQNAARLAAEYVERIEPYPETFSGRGIVTCAGGPCYNTCAWVLIKMLRHLGCKLPIEVWFLGEQERDEDWIALVEPLGVRCVEALEAPAGHKHPRWAGWSLKSYAILHSAFGEVLFLDADNVPVRDPTYLFEEPAYRRHGAIFWQDGRRTPKQDPCWNIFGVRHRDEYEQESGQILIDKQRCWRPLCLANWYNEHAGFFYKYVYGDKDTFRFAWHRLGRRFARPSRGVERMRKTLCQHDLSGRRLFQHRWGDKWCGTGNRKIPGFVHERECQAYVAELQGRWSPIVSRMKRSSPEDRKKTADLWNQEFFYFRGRRCRWRLRLTDRGIIAGGRPHDQAFWWVEEGKLVVAARDGRPTWRFQGDRDGLWRSTWNQYACPHDHLAPTSVWPPRSPSHP